ncbi:hypothetical protein [Pontibacter vulgaris]|uniref:hypothetical protein n=1 Tax=Pontibacter vulgaris TaxID=2905679 RepID=UPI001FA78BFF|nr:hypothetical protein [Pontibacter vulgaris]
MYSKFLEDLSKAIGARLLVEFEYSNQKYKVEPHLLGNNQNKQDCLCAWQRSTVHMPELKEGWHCFLLSGISNLVLLEERFNNTRPGYEPYNSSMSRIYYRI